MKQLYTFTIFISFFFTCHISKGQLLSGMHNKGFETGDCSYWTIKKGVPNYSSETLNGEVYLLTTGGSVTNCGNSQNTIVNSGYDSIIGTYLPKVCTDCGNYTMQMGDYLGNKKTASFEQHFDVAPSNTLVTINYALIFTDTIHDLYEQPYFRIRTTDANGNLIPCGQYCTSSGDASIILQNGYYYKPWSNFQINLMPYMNSPVTIEVIISDCAEGGHFGYAYVDITSSAPEITCIPPAICGNNYATLSAPFNGSYSWTGPQGYNGSDYTQSISTNIPGSYHLHGLIGNTSTCTIDLDTSITINPSPQIAQVDSGLNICSNGGNVNLIATPIGGSWSGNGIIDSLNGTYDPLINGDGNYTVAYTFNDGGCISADTMYVHVDACTGINEQLANNIIIQSNQDHVLELLQQNNFYTKYVIYDVLGKVISETTISENNILINKIGLSSGLYFIKFSNTKQQQIFRIIKN